MKYFQIWFKSQYHSDEYFGKAESIFQCEARFNQWYDTGKECEYGELLEFGCVEVSPGEYYVREKTNPKIILF